MLCLLCGQPANSMCLACSVPYCSEECQRTDWPRHVSVCISGVDDWAYADVQADNERLWVYTADGPWRYFDATNKRDTIMTLFTDATDPTKINPVRVYEFVDNIRPLVEGYVADWTHRDDSIKIDGLLVQVARKRIINAKSKVRKDFALYLRRRAPKLARVLEYLETDFQRSVVAHAMSTQTGIKIWDDEPISAVTHPLINLYVNVKSAGAKSMLMPLVSFVREWHERDDSLKTADPDDFITRPESGPRKDFILYMMKRAPALSRQLHTDAGAESVERAMQQFYSGA